MLIQVRNSEIDIATILLHRTAIDQVQKGNHGSAIFFGMIPSEMYKFFYILTKQLNATNS
jgi:hypothetical protein